MIAECEASAEPIAHPVVASRQDCLVLPYLATTERKAEMFADAIDELYCLSVETEVFEDRKGWGVAVVKGMHEINDPLDRFIEAAAILVSAFDLTERPDSGYVHGLAQGLKDIPPLQKALAKRARRIFRIEDKMDAILARLACLGNPDTKSPEDTPCERCAHERHA